MVSRQHGVLVSVTVVVCSMFMSFDQAILGGVAEEQQSAAALGELSKALGAAKKPDEKRQLLGKVGKIKSRYALNLAVAVVADEEVAESARAAVGEIAQALMAPEQLPYIRRLAFLRWARCLPDEQAAKLVIDALPGDDIVLRDAAMAVVYERAESRVIELAAGEITSLPAAVQRELIAILTSHSNGSTTAALVGMTCNEDKRVAVAAVEALGKQGGEKALARLGEVLGEDDAEMRAAALHAMAELGNVDKPDEATQATLLEALKLATGKTAQEAGAGEAVVAAVQIAQTLAASHPEEVQQALEKLESRELSESMGELVAGARLLFTIDQLPNLAEGAKASSPDDLESEGGSKGDAAAIDGNASTYWDETDGHPLYKLRVEFPKATDVSAISVSGWAHHSFSPKDFTIVCDDKTVKTVTGATYANNRLIVLFPRTRCTSLELRISGYYGGSPAVRELGIFDVR